MDSDGEQTSLPLEPPAVATYEVTSRRAKCRKASAVKIAE
jgi:hypothetical protein